MKRTHITFLSMYAAVFLLALSVTLPVSAYRYAPGTAEEYEENTEPVQTKKLGYGGGYNEGVRSLESQFSQRQAEAADSPRRRSAPPPLSARAEGGQDALDPTRFDRTESDTEEAHAGAPLRGKGKPGLPDTGMGSVAFFLGLLGIAALVVRQRLRSLEASVVTLASE